MNIVTSYMRKWVDRGSRGKKPKGARRIREYEYFRNLAFLHKTLIAKHMKTIEVEEVYSLGCVRNLPLCNSYDNNLKKCPLFPNERYIEQQEGKPYAKNTKMYHTDRINSEACLRCWTTALEDPSASMAPPEPKSTPVFLKREKQVPAFLKKK